MTSVAARPSPLSATRLSAKQLSALYAGAVLAIEAAALVRPEVSLGLHACVVFFAAVRSTAAMTTPSDHLLGAFAILSLGRLAMTATTTPEWPPLVTIALSGSIILVAIVALASTVAVDLRSIVGVPSAKAPLLLGPVGIALGAAAYAILDLDRAQTTLLDRPHTNAALTALTLLTLLMFVGFAEELLYRGLIQTHMVATFGRPGIVIVAVLYGLGIATVATASHALVFGAIALLLGAIRHYSGSVVPAAIAHGFMAYSIVEIWPDVY